MLARASQRRTEPAASVVPIQPTGAELTGGEHGIYYTKGDGVPRNRRLRLMTPAW